MKLECCDVELDYESAGRRDTETIGGYSVEYFICSECKQRYELIGNSLCMTEEEP